MGEVWVGAGGASPLETCLCCGRDGRSICANHEGPRGEESACFTEQGCTTRSREEGQGPRGVPVGAEERAPNGDQ